MLIFGHRFIDNQNFYHISDIDSIQNTPPSSCVLIEFEEENLDIIKHCSLNSIAIAILAKNITEIIYSSTLGASYIIVNKSLAKMAQDLAQNYLFDAKILVMLEKEQDIEELALLGIDGILFSNAIIKII